MKVQIGKGGSHSTAATLLDYDLQPCANGAYLLSQELPDGQTTDAIRRLIVDGEHTVAKSGDVRVLLRARCRVPLSSYNVSGVVVTNVPEFQVHTVLTLPKVVAAALAGTLTTTPDPESSTGSAPAQTVAQNTIAEAVAVLATIMTNQPTNITYVLSGMFNSPWMKGVMGVCPMNYTESDFGQIRVLPPPQRS